MFIGFVMRAIAGWIESRTKDHDSACIDQLVDWIENGTLDDAFRADASRVTLCVLESMAILVLAIVGEYHDHDSAPDNLPPIYAAATYKTLTADQLGKVIRLGQALGQDMPPVATMSAATAPATLDPLLVSILIELAKLLFDRWSR